MIYITRKNAALFYNSSLDNPNISVDRMIEEFYKSINKTPEEIEKEKEDYRVFIKDAKDHGQQNEEIYYYLLAKRDEIVEAKLDDKGNIT